MRYFYDTEFLEDGKTVDLISIGIVAEDGREYYAVSDECVSRRFARRIRKNGWLMANVVPSLPKAYGDARNHTPRSWLFNYHGHEVKPRAQIAQEVKALLLKDEAPELWADYGAYDHVALCQLWGRMIDLPSGMPMFTRDIQQEAARQGYAWDQLPQQDEGLHNALADARHCKVKYDFLHAAC